MKVQRIKDHLVVRIEKGEEIITALKQTTQNYKIKGAFFFGLGVGQDLVLGYYDSHKKTYLKKAFKGEYEFTSLSGNVALSKKEIIVHCHVTISDYRFHAFGGHLLQSTVPATCEIMIFPFKKPLKRKKDRSTGLVLLDLID
jgi:predicted DNA-binding protein with PD1-like motif